MGRGSKIKAGAPRCCSCNGPDRRRIAKKQGIWDRGDLPRYAEGSRHLYAPPSAQVPRTSVVAGVEIRKANSEIRKSVASCQRPSALAFRDPRFAFLAPADVGPCR